jgi:hypothetical protein
MTHAEFINAYNQGKIEIAVNRSAAMHVCDQKGALPGNVRAAHLFWKNLGCLMPIAGLVALIWVPWYWSVVGIVAGFFVMSATRQSAAGFVLEHALQNPAFWSAMVERGVLTMRETAA